MPRSTTVKSFEEANLKIMEMLLSGAESDGLYETLKFTDASQNRTLVAGTVESTPSSGLVLVIPKVAILSDVTLDLDGTTTVAFTAPHPAGLAKAVTIITGLASTVSSGGVAGQVFDMMKVYDLSAVTAEKFTQNMSGATPVLSREVRDKGTLNHRKVMANVERTISVNQLFTNFDNGLAKYAQIPSVIAVIREDDQAGLETEVELYYQCYFQGPHPNESLGDSDSDMTYDIRFERFASVLASEITASI